MGFLSGVVTRGINNIYSVDVENDQPFSAECRTTYECRIKGKVLQGIDDDYNPIAVGDTVRLVPTSSTEGLIVQRMDRRSSFIRWNAKRGCDQIVAANIDLVVIVGSSDEPPFRPRFIDRAIACTTGCPVLIVLNKCDLLISEEEDNRFRLYEKVGFDVFAMSAYDEAGILALKSRLEGKVSAFVGQSGVGKSTLVNALAGISRQKVGQISEKFNRGRHTTNHSIMIKCGTFAIIDTPGVKELLVPHSDPAAMVQAFPEFINYASKCSFQPCLHWHEPDCAVKSALEEHILDPDRYESYIRMLVSIEERPEEWESDRR
ncbi:MAG: ribosome small subunit-dependent GTPase A [Spirochaetales bacterium]|nr:ribosome small subunit-dependent GTPase A [Spirochaetales bacterium]